MSKQQEKNREKEEEEEEEEETSFIGVERLQDVGINAGVGVHIQCIQRLQQYLTTILYRT